MHIAMNWHIPTLFVVSIASSAVMALSIAFIAHRRQKDLFLWSVALALQALSYVLYSLRGHVHDLWSVVLGNMALTASLALFADCICQFQRRSAPRRLIWAPVAVVGVGFCFLLDDFTARIILLSTVLMFQSGLVAALLLQRHRQTPGRGQYLLATGALLTAAVMASRVWVTWHGVVQTQSLTDPNVIQGAVYLVSILSTLLLSMGLLMMTEERAAHALRVSEHYQQFRTHVLELLSRGEPLPQLLNAIVRGIEQMHPRMLCSILQLDRQGKHLIQGVAPSLPDFYNAAIDGLAIGPGVGSCGAAAATGQRVVVERIAEHPDWVPFAALAQRAGLVACWSQPILSSSKRVLGTFAIYHAQAHAPSPEDIALIEQTALLVGIAIERSTAASQLRERERNYRLLIESSNEGIGVACAGVLRFANPKLRELMGYDDAELLGRPFLDFVDAPDRERVRADYRQRAVGAQVAQVYPLHVQTKHRGLRWFEASATELEWEGAPAVLLFMIDVTERKQTDERIQQLAYHDALTQLPNRRLLMDRLTMVLASHARSGQYGALMFLDLDNFKPLNDTHGHKVGDLLLIEVARRLKAHVRQMDTVARFGGDEFVVLLSNLHGDEATSRDEAHSISAKVLEALSAPYRLLVQQPDAVDHLVEHHCTASIGVLLFGSGAGSEDELIKQADMAMYQAKQGGRNRVVFVGATAADGVPG